MSSRRVHSTCSWSGSEERAARLYSLWNYPMWSYFGETSFKDLIAFFFNWTVVDLQSTVSFRCKQSDGHTHTQISSMSFSDYFVWLCQQCPLGPADPSLLPAAPLRPLLEVIGSERRQRRNCAFCSVCWPCPGCLPWLSPFTLTLTAEIGASSTSLLQMQSGLREAQPVAHRPRSW